MEEVKLILPHLSSLLVYLQSGDDTPSDESDDSKDDGWYGEVKEYFTESDWKKMPKALKRREKNRFELHEKQMRLS